MGDKAGREGLKHTKADKMNISSEVSISFYDGERTIGDTRKVTDEAGNLPAICKKIVNNRKLNFIIRGHELRKFVEDSSPEERYKEVSEWFDLSSLTTIQANIRNLRVDINREIESPDAVNERLKDLLQITNGTLGKWNVDTILNWINKELLLPLDSKLELIELDYESSIYKEIKRRKEEEDKSLGLAALRQLSKNISEIFKKDSEEKNTYSGVLLSFEKLKFDYDDAKKKKENEKKKSEKIVFKGVWEQAKTLFENAPQVIDKCPVCTTPILESTAGSHENILIYLSNELKYLEDYDKAVKSFNSCKTGIENALSNLQSKLVTLQSNLESADLKETAKKIGFVKELLDPWCIDESCPDMSDFKSTLLHIFTNVSDNINRIEKEKGENTYSSVFEKISSLIALQENLDRIAKYKEQLKLLFQNLESIDNFSCNEIRNFVQGVIDKLREDVNELYRAVHVDEIEAPPIRFELPSDTKKPLLKLLIDFDEHHKGVSPGGYLSDSQIRTLALSLRLAAFRLFNKDVPIIVLDDVVTSYDADHRRAIAGMLAKYFKDFQIILVTHDERFFQYLKEHLSPATWYFKRILELKPDFGPYFHDHRISDELIEISLSQNKSAANDIRQAEEEWLLRICREFGVNIRIRSLHHPYTYDRSELAEALCGFLKECKIAVPTIEGINNPFLLSLQAGNVENFGSHFSDDPNACGSIGDEKKRWKEFKEFRDFFKCPSCGRNRFMRPEEAKFPLCAKCNTPFSFML